jgi:hypothetical protein
VIEKAAFEGDTSWRAMVRGPRSIANATINSSEPSVKLTANLEGTNRTIGRNRKIARARNTIPPTSASTKPWKRCVLQAHRAAKQAHQLSIQAYTGEAIHASDAPDSNKNDK